MPDIDLVNAPPHYKSPSGLEAITVIEAFVDFESYALGNVLKYCLRYKKKGGVADLEKANWYLTRLISKMK